MTAFDKFKKLVEHVKQDHGSEALEALEWDEFAGAVVELEPSLTSELSALQKENLGLKDSYECACATEQLHMKELEQLRTQNRELREALELAQKRYRLINATKVDEITTLPTPYDKALALQPEK